MSDQNVNANPKMLVQIGLPYLLLAVSLIASLGYIIGPTDLRTYHFVAGELFLITTISMAMRWWASRMRRDLILAIIAFFITNLHFFTTTWRLNPDNF